MGELERLGEEVRAELGVPSASWLRAQKQRVLRTAAPSRGEPRRALWVAAAATVVLGVGLALASFVNFGAEPARPATLALSAGAETNRVRLDDGSSVALNPGARALVENAPAVTRFDLQRGYAEFDVAHQGSRRFVVLAGAVEVTVVGTRFSVLHDASDIVEVRVTHGIVSVRSPDRGAPVLLKAGERFRGGAVAAASAAPLEPVPAPEAVPAPSTATEPSVVPPPGAPGASAGSPDWEAAYRERRYAVAAARAREHGVERLLGSLSAQKLAELGDAARLGGDADLALRGLDALQRRFPNSSQAADADFLSGKLLATRGQPQLAIARFEQYLKRGERAYTIEAMGRLVELYSSNGDSSHARAMAERYLERSPHGPYRRLCLSTLEKR